MTQPVPATTPKTGAKKPSGSGLNQKFGPLPIWGWAVLIVGAYVAYKYIAGSKAKAAAATTQSQPIYQTAGNLPQTTSTGTTAIVTNQEWSQAAQKDLVQKGHDPAQSAAACAAYIAGNTLTADETGLIDIALQDIGPLPETPSNGGSQLSALEPPKDGNLFGEIAYGIANALGLGNPNNPFAGIVDPIVNDITQQGPISGTATAAQQILGGNASASVSGANIPTPAGNITVGGQIGTGSGISASASAPGGIGGSVSVSPNNSATSIGTYTVQQGDTLQSISTTVYGNAGGAQQIYTANLTRIPDPSNLVPGTVLTIPSPS